MEVKLCYKMFCMASLMPDLVSTSIWLMSRL